MDYKKQGKKNRASGAAFELRVRKDLESSGWIVSKWMNNVEFEIKVNGLPDVTVTAEKGKGAKVKIDSNEELIGKLISAKHKFRGPGIPMAIGTGFPDFIAFKRIFCEPCMEELGLEDGQEIANQITCEVIGVESKSNGYLDKIEKEKCMWLLDNQVFSKILIAKKIKVGRKVEIEYIDFEEKYGDNKKKAN